MNPLRKLGYTVLEASCGEEARDFLVRTSQPVDLLLTDVVMPSMSGRELAEMLRGACPDLRVLFTSGHTDDAIMRHGVQHGEVAFLPKPYDLNTLAQRVRGVLDLPVTRPAPAR